MKEERERESFDGHSFCHPAAEGKIFSTCLLIVFVSLIDDD
jgi:hypothetical protein